MIKIDKTLQIHAPVEKVFAFWEKFENFSRFISCVESVIPQGDSKTHWIITGPLNMRMEFDTETIEKKPNEYIKWRSFHHEMEGMEERGVTSSGELFFKPFGEEETEVILRMEYSTPNKITDVLGQAMNSMGYPDKMFDEGLEKIKQQIESDYFSV